MHPNTATGTNTMSSRPHPKWWEEIADVGQGLVRLVPLQEDLHRVCADYSPFSNPAGPAKGRPSPWLAL